MIRSIVATSGLIATWALVLVSSCLGQGRVQSITDVLSTAHVSGSLAYWSPERCRPEPFRYPPFPKLQPTSYSGAPVDALRRMFADDPKMRVTQDRGGIVRMVETGVPDDFLNVRIHHVQFDLSQFGLPVAGGPNIEMRKIMLTPEVQAFKRAHNLGPFSGFRVPGDATTDPRHVPGELNEVTVSQALDYVLQSFPGYWIYGNCTNEGGQREVYFWFIENVPENSAKFPTARRADVSK